VRQAVQRAECRHSEPDAVSSDVIALVVLWRLRYKLSLRDLPEMFLIRGPSTVRAPVLIGHGRFDYLNTSHTPLGRSSRPLANILVVRTRLWQRAECDGHREVIDDLHGKINQLQVERDFLAGQPAILSTAERRAMIAPNATCI
jgi:hypothetical protein